MLLPLLPSNINYGREDNTMFVLREGRSSAEEEALQEGFDQGYKEGFTWAKQVGRLRGKLTAKRVQFKESGSEIVLQLEELAKEVEKLEFGKDVKKLEQRLCSLK